PGITTSHRTIGPEVVVTYYCRSGHGLDAAPGGPSSVRQSRREQFLLHPPLSQQQKTLPSPPVLLLLQSRWPLLMVAGVLLGRSSRWGSSLCPHVR
ncbi:hypothetical protein GBAR_LOCUS26515, partial [Geodia barretti]